ncbi:MAG: RNA polymerase sigma factor [Myxococcales bacterium]|nr:RNA polymerase sigma factor [Myxococcales bacterium]
MTQSPEQRDETADTMLSRSYRIEAPVVRAYLRKLGVSAASVEDLAHDVFQVALRRFAEYDQQRPLRPWLLGIAFRTASDHLRRPQHHVEVAGEVPEYTALQSAPPSAHRHAVKKQRNALLQRALKTLSPDHRAVLELHELEGLSMRSVAERLGTTLHFAQRRLADAKAELLCAVQSLAITSIST